MAYDVRFLKGLSNAYNSLSAKDPNAFYFTTDDNQLYLGEIKLSSGTEIADAIKKITKNETDITSIQAQLTIITGEAEGSIKKAVADAKSELQTQIGTLGSLTTTKKDNLVNAINEVKAAVSAGGEAGVVTVEDSGPASEGAAKTYVIKQGGSQVGKIDIPKDMVVTSGKVEVNPKDQDPGTYIVLEIANGDTLYVEVGKLVDIYTASTSKDRVAITVTNHAIGADLVADSITDTYLATDSVTTVKIADANVTEDKLAANAVTSAKIAEGAVGATQLASDAVTENSIADGAVTNDKLDESLQQAITKAGSSVQAVTEGKTNGTIDVDGLEVKVHGLGTAAYSDTTAFDTAGAAESAETNAKAYVDTALTWGPIAEV